MKNNTYWLSYKEIESKIVKLSRDIEFDDVNLDNGVHSVTIANLILQCAANIESVSKDIYIENCEKTSRMKLEYDYDCVLWMINAWGINERVLDCKLVRGDCKKRNRRYKPFDNLGKEKKWRGKMVPCWAWNEAYQDIKHDFIEAIKRSATLHNLLEVAAAFYILVLYYEDLELLPEIRINGYYFNPMSTHLDTELFLPSACLSNKDSQKSENIIRRKECLVIPEDGKFESDGVLAPCKFVMNKEC